MENNNQFQLSPVGQQTAQFELCQRVAQAYNASTIVPTQYRGKEGFGNMVIAVDMVIRMGVSPIAVCQQMSVVSGKPCWSGSFLIAAVNATGRFSPLRFEEVGEPMKPGWKVRAWAHEINPDGSYGERLNGDWITTELVNAEGWSKKAGSKWLTMPRQMARYRAGAFFQRVYAAEVAMGMRTVDEEIDIANSRTVVDAVAEEVKVSFAAPQPQEKPQPEQVTTAAPKVAQTAGKPGPRVVVNDNPEDLFK